MIRSLFFKKTAYLFLVVSIAITQTTQPQPDGINDPSAGLSLWNKCARSVNTYLLKPLDQYIVKPSVKYHIPDIIGISSFAAFIGLACWIEYGYGKPNAFEWPNIAAGVTGSVAGLYGIGDALWLTMKSYWQKQLGICRADSEAWQINPTQLRTLDAIVANDELKNKVRPLIESVRDYLSNIEPLNSLEHNYIFYDASSDSHARWSRHVFISAVMGSVISINPAFHAVEIPQNAFDHNAAYIIEFLNLQAPCIAFVAVHNDEYRKEATTIDLMELINERKKDPKKQPIILLVSGEMGPINTHITEETIL